MPTFTFQRATPFGPATFTVLYAEDGTVTGLSSSAEGMSSTMLKLTFGDRAETAGKYFAALSANMGYQLEGAPFLNEVANYLTEISAAFSDLRRAGEGSLSKLPEASRFRASFWQRYAKLRTALFFDQGGLDGALQKFAGNSRKWAKESPETLAALEPWVHTLFDLVDAGSTRLVWIILGHLNTSSAADLMLTQLERKGLHPQGAAILKGLLYCFAADRDAERLLALGDRSAFREDFARPYLRVMEAVQDPSAVDVARAILFQRVEAAPEAIRVFAANNIADPLAIAREAFWKTEAFWVVFRYVELFREMAPPEEQLTLADVNKKLAEPIFTDSAPVTWHQQLSDSWKGLLDATDPDERMRIIVEYVSRPEARLQYNSLLQLNYLLRSGSPPNAGLAEEIPVTTPARAVLERLQELVTHRFDKVAAQAIAAIRKVVDQMPDPAALNANLMPISTKPGLRVAKLKLLRTLGERSDVHRAQQAYFGTYVNSDLTPDERMVTQSIIKYLKLKPATS